MKPAWGVMRDSSPFTPTGTLKGWHYILSSLFPWCNKKKKVKIIIIMSAGVPADEMCLLIRHPPGVWWATGACSLGSGRRERFYCSRWKDDEAEDLCASGQRSSSQCCDTSSSSATVGLIWGAGITSSAKQRSERNLKMLTPGLCFAMNEHGSLQKIWFLDNFFLLDTDGWTPCREKRKGKKVKNPPFNAFTLHISYYVSSVCGVQWTLWSRRCFLSVCLASPHFLKLPCTSSRD